MCSSRAEAGSTPTLEISSSTSSVVSDLPASIAPNKWTDGAPAGSLGTIASRLITASSGASGDQACQAAIRAAAQPAGHVRCTVVVAGGATVPNASSVTTPNPPGPGPRTPREHARGRAGAGARARGRPERLGSALGAEGDAAAAGRDDLRTDELVAGQTVPAAEDPK